MLMGPAGPGAGADGVWERVEGRRKKRWVRDKRIRGEAIVMAVVVAVVAVAVGMGVEEGIYGGRGKEECVGMGWLL